MQDVAWTKAFGSHWENGWVESEGAGLRQCRVVAMGGHRQSQRMVAAKVVRHPRRLRVAGMGASRLY